MSNHLEILRQNGKSFYWAGKLLPKKYFVRCAELYSFCRLLDDIADTNTKDENFIKFYHFKKKHHFVILLLLPQCSKAAKQLLDSQLTDQNRIGK